MVEERHEDWRIALYYHYVENLDAKEHTEFQQELCLRHELNGRVRVSPEGINGVLSGTHSALLAYEEAFRAVLEQIPGHNMQDFVIKYCQLRPDLSVKAQLFDSLQVKQTNAVIALFDQSISESKRGKSRRRRHRVRDEEKDAMREVHKEMFKRQPAKHLSADDWNERLHSLSTLDSSSALLLDVRNCYESRVGHFAVPNVPTMLTNTRKYSDLPSMLASNEEIQKRDQVFMYCTGGVRCERVSMMLQTMYPEKTFYQLDGGIQTYLKNSPEESNIFEGKNFVFDPRRTDPIHFGGVVGKCLVCKTPHDDYDNGHAPNEGREARCCTCRMLVLICNDCRPNYQCWDEKDKHELPKLYCGTNGCIHEGAAPQPELVNVPPPTTTMSLQGL